MTAAM